MLKSEMGCIMMKKITAIITVLAACASLTACNKAPGNVQSFDDIKLVRTGFADRRVFENLAALEDYVDLAVVGKFTGDSEQEERYHYSEFFGKDVLYFVTSQNTIEVEKVLIGDAEIGDTLQIVQDYGIVDGKLVTYSDLTPMQKGDEWLFFLKKETDLDVYFCAGDSDGRFPVPNAENEPMPLSDCPDLGVYDEQNFMWNTYNEILEKYDI